MHSPLTGSSFDRLLLLLDADRDRAGEQYELLRRKLVKFFECRRSPTAEDDADETITRVARKIEEGEAINQVAAYSYGVARLVLLESNRQHRRQMTLVEPVPAVHADRDSTEAEARLACLERCLDGLPAATRDLLVSYYEGSKSGRIRQRHRLADAHGMPINALRIRVHRLRAKLEDCVKRCQLEDAR
jgi:DNA-directed RNA polymerase specialized sigma24 family protein